MDHKWHLVIAKGNDAPGDSLDSIYWCERCGCVRHDYAHGGGMKSPNYPRYFAHNGRSGKDEPTCYSARIEPGLAELEEATVLANLVLDRPYGDPDDDLAMLARQFLRARERERAAYLAGATAYAAQAIHSCLFSENALLRKVRDNYKPFVPDAGYEAGVKCKRCHVALYDDAAKVGYCADHEPRVCPMCLTGNLAVKDGMHQCQDCGGLWRHDELKEINGNEP